MVNIHPDELYIQLHEKASVRKRRTLELIHETCRIQSKSSVKDFSITTIASLLSDKGGPSEQALRNRTSSASDYRALISKWAEYSNSSFGKPVKQQPTGLNNEILANVTDPTTRAMVGMILAENKKLKNENSLLKQHKTLTIDMRKSKDEVSSGGQNAVLVSPSHDLTEMEIKALREAISDDFMQHRGWTVDDYGRVKEKGVQVYKPGYVSAIDKVLKGI
ncbi:MAG: hypothetical protein JJE49_05625 [Peptostreptococcaceae bacterium]|nr:hypothetical protein [Peptostreptococcaceae bacterium]